MRLDNPYNYESKNSFGGKFTNTQQTIGVGIFIVNKVNQDFSRYFGARIAHTTDESSSNDSNTDKTTSTALTPMIGLDYSINKNVSIALEAGLTIFDGKYDDGFSSNDESGEATFSQLMARYYF